MKIIKYIMIMIVSICTITGAIAFVKEIFTFQSDRRRANGIYEKFLKRPIDAFMAMGAMIVLSPILLITALLVRIKLGSPIIFKQDRPGKNEKVFKLYKFRTMTDQRNANGELLPDSERLTPFGNILRSTSLDELPELYNIVKGEMAIVGPRPLLVEYLPYYTDKEKHRHDVRPGLTGLAQVNGRNAISWDKKLEYDVIYLRDISFINDLKIIIKTIGKTLSRSDIQVGAEFKAGKFIDQRKERLMNDISKK